MQINYLSKFVAEIKKQSKYWELHDINGGEMPNPIKYRTGVLSFLFSIAVTCFLNNGFNDSFSGYIIAFLGIFIGLFTNIIVALQNKIPTLNQSILSKETSLVEKQTSKNILNYIIQFTALTSNAIVVAIYIIVLLMISLLSKYFQTDVLQFKSIHFISEVNLTTAWNFLKLFLLVFHRFATIFLLCKFFIVALFSITSYFTHLLYDNKRNLENLKQNHD